MEVKVQNMMRLGFEQADIEKAQKLAKSVNNKMIQFYSYTHREEEQDKEEDFELQM